MANTSDDKIRRLYDSGKKYYSLPDFDTFRKDMQDEGKRKRFYNNMQLHYSLPEYDTFTKDIGVGAVAQQPVRQPAQQPAAGRTGQTGRTSQTVQRPAQKTSQPQQGHWEPNVVQRRMFEATVNNAKARAGNLGSGTRERIANIEKGNKPGAFMGERELNPETGKTDKVYYTTRGERVSTPMEHSWINTRHNEWWENNTEEGRKSRERRLQREFEDRLERLWSRHDADGEENAAEKAWKAAEARQNNAMNRNAADVYGDKGSPYATAAMVAGRENRTMNAAELSQRDMVSHFTNFDLDRMMGEAWMNLGEEGQKALIDDCYQMLSRRNPGADKIELYNAAKEMARRQSNLRLYNLAVEKNLPKGNLEYLMREIGDMNTMTDLSKGLAVARAGGKTGDMAAYEASNKQYRQDGHKILGYAGMVAGFSLDPTVWMAGGLGGLAGKVALKLGGRWLAGRGASAALRQAATRGLATSFQGRLLAGMAGGSANFAGFEAGKDAGRQFAHGGNVTQYNEQGELAREGRYVNEGYSPGAIAAQGGHGLMMGAAIGWLGPVAGNVSDKLVRGTASTAGKVAGRAGVYTGSTVLEGTIFSVPEWIEGERNGWDVWGDNIAMMTAFKGKNMLKSTAGVLGDLKASFSHPTEGRKNRLDFESRLRQRMDAPSDAAMGWDENGKKIAVEGMGLTRDERAELDRHGYGDLRQMVEGDKERSGKPEQPEQSEDKAGEVVDRLKQMVEDARVSEAARAKMYYYATGRRLQPSSVLRGELVEDGKGGFIVESQGVNGVVTSRSFKSRKAADLELGRIGRQAELNRVEIGERYRQTADFEERLQDACRTVAEENGWDMVEVYRTCEEARRNHLSGGDRQFDEAQQNIIQKVADAMGEFDETEATDAIRGRINGKYGVDIDGAIRKEANRRTTEEQTAIDEYISELFPKKEKEHNPVENVDAEDITEQGLLTYDTAAPQDTAYGEPLGRAVMRFQDREVEVLSGKVVTMEDGTVIDTRRSDGTVVVRDVETGKVEMVSPEDMLSYEDYKPWEPGREPAAQQREAEASAPDQPEDGATGQHLQTGQPLQGGAATEEAEAAQPAPEAGGAQAVPKYGRKGQITVRDSDGTERQGWLTGHVDEDGNYEYYLAGDLKRLHYASERELDAMLSSYIPDEAAPRQEGEPAAEAAAPDQPEGEAKDGKPQGTPADAEEAVIRGGISGTADGLKEAFATERERIGNEWLDDPGVQDALRVYADGASTVEDLVERAKADSNEERTRQRLDTLLEFDSTRGKLQQLLTGDAQTGETSQKPVDEEAYNRGRELGLKDLESFTDDRLDYEIDKLHSNAELLTDFGRGMLDAYEAERQKRQQAAAQTGRTGETNPTQEPAAVEDRRTALQRIPHDSKGEPIYEQAENPEAGWDALVESRGGDKEKAKVVAGMMAENKGKELEKARRQKPKGRTAAEIEKSQDAIAAETARLEKEHDMWSRIANVEQRRQDAIRAQQEAEARQRAAERAEAEKAEREAREEVARLEREALEGIPEWHLDTPENARKRGVRRFSGQMFTRQEPVQGVVGNEVEVKFSQSDIPKGRVAVIEVSRLQPSHMQGQRNPMFFIDEAQPKDRAEAVSVHAARKIAEELRPHEITGSATAYTGAPTVNTRGEVIQGNNRSDALRYLWENKLPEQQQTYKQYLIDNAEQFGIDAEAVNAMQQPVLVNMLDVDDAEAIRLGQMTAQDTESGGMERIRPKNVAGKLGDDMRRFAMLLLQSGEEEATFGQLVDRNGVEALKWLVQTGAISDTQYRSAFDSKGNMTPEAKNDLQRILYQAVFKGGSQQLEEMFDRLPVKAQRALLSTAFRDMESPDGGKMLPEIQASVAAFGQLMDYKPFANASKMEDVLRAVEDFKRQYLLDDRLEQYMPADNFSNFALHLAAMYKASDMPQTTIAACFNRMFDLAQGRTEANVFAQQADSREYKLDEIVRKEFGFEYKPARNGRKNDSNGGSSLAGGDKPGERGERGDAGLSPGGEQNPAGTEPSERGAGASDDSRTVRQDGINQGNSLGATRDKGIDDFFGPVYTEFQGKGNEAEAHLREVCEGVAKGALIYPGIAPIDLAWGDKKAGYMKIVIKHPEVVGRLQELINQCAITNQSDNRIVLESDTHKFIVSKMKGLTPTDNWLLTAYEKKEKSVSASSSDIETEPEGKRNGTATPQNGLIESKLQTAASQPHGLASDSKVNDSALEKQVSGSESSVQPEEGQESGKQGKEPDLFGFTNPKEEYYSGVMHSDGFRWATDGQLMVRRKAAYDPSLEGKMVDRRGREVGRHPSPHGFREAMVMSGTKEIEVSRLERLHGAAVDEGAGSVVVETGNGVFRYYTAPLGKMLGEVRRLGLSSLDVGRFGHIGFDVPGEAAIMHGEERPPVDGMVMTEYGMVEAEYLDQGLGDILDKARNRKAVIVDVDQTPTSVNAEGMVSDSDGRPLTLYHGTTNDVESLGDLRAGHTRRGLDAPARFNGDGISFTPYRDVAEDYATAGDGSMGKVFEANIILRKPYYTVGVANMTPKEAVRFSETLKARGHDGIINYANKVIKEMGAEPNEVIVFDISSAVEVEKGKPSLRSGHDEIEDFGERILGARKDMLGDFARSVENVTVQSLIELPMSKAFRRPNLKKMVESGAISDSDAALAEAVLQGLVYARKKPALTRRMSSRHEIKEWADEVYTGIRMLGEILSGSEERKAAALAEHRVRMEAERDKMNAHIANLRQWNPGKTFHDVESVPDKVEVIRRVLEGIGYSAGDKVSLPLARVGLNVTGQSYEVGSAGKQGALWFNKYHNSLDEAIETMVLAARLAHGDRDVEIPGQYLSIRGVGNPRMELTGKYEVAYFAKNGKTVKDAVFDTKEEAEAFASEHNGHVIGQRKYTNEYDRYVAAVTNPLTGNRHPIGDEFADRAELSAWMDEHHDEMNALAVEAVYDEMDTKAVSREHFYIGAWSHRGKLVYSVVENDRNNPWPIVKDFQTRKEAEQWLKEHRAELEERRLKRNEATKGVVYYNTNATRTGKDWREGKDATPQMYDETFGFRGVQFGNWTNGGDRQMAMNQAYDALMDLAQQLGLSPRAMSLNGELGLAFGARGGGSASAHYEPMQVVINLTKTRGAGALAHEWWHALDNYMSRRAGVTLGHATHGNGAENMDPDVAEAVSGLMSAVKRSHYGERSKQKGDYWGRGTEMTARLFESWIAERIKADGDGSPFLAAGLNEKSRELYQELNYLAYRADEMRRAEFEKRAPNIMSKEEFFKTPQSLNGYPYPTVEELKEFSPVLERLFGLLSEKESEGMIASEPGRGYRRRKRSTSTGMSLFDWAENEERERRMELERTEEAIAASDADAAMDRYAETYNDYLRQVAAMESQLEKEGADDALREEIAGQMEAGESLVLEERARLEESLRQYYVRNNTPEDAQRIARDMVYRLQAEVEVHNRKNHILRDILENTDKAPVGIAEGNHPDAEVGRGEVKTGSGRISYEAQGHLPDADAGEFAYVERQFSRTGEFSFTGSGRIKDRGDVAYLFRNLEDYSVENVFAVIVKDGVAKVLHIGMGTARASAADMGAIRSGVDAFGADKVYLVHNHPSGNLTASHEDRRLMQTLEKAFEGEIETEGIIIDTTSGRYLTFDGGGESEVYDRPSAARDGSESEPEVLRFNLADRSRMPAQVVQIHGPGDVSGLLGRMRFGDGAKVGYLILSNSSHVIGNFHTGYTALTDEELAREMASVATKYGGARVIVYGNMDLEGARQLQERVGRHSLGGVQLLDVLGVRNGIRSSARDDGMIYEPEEPYSAMAREPMARRRENFDEMRERAVRERGVVTRGLIGAQVRVVDVPRHDFSGTGRQALQKAEKWAKENIVGIHTATDSRGEEFDYSISNDAVEKYVSRSATGKSENIGVHLAALKKLPGIISESVEAEVHPDYTKNDSVRTASNEVNSDTIIHRFYGAAKIDGTVYRVKTTFREYADNNRKPTAHSYEVTQIELLEAPSDGVKDDSGEHLAMTSYSSIPVAKLLKGVEKSYDPGKKLLDVSENDGHEDEGGVDADIRFREVDDEEVLKEFAEGRTVKAYRTMQVIDGRLYYPMAAKVGGKETPEIRLGVPEQAEEHPEIIKETIINKDGNEQGIVVIDKGLGKGSLKVAYNPYVHTSRTVLNDQFSSAYKRPNLVTVEVEVPESELTSGYRADKAKNSVGEMAWHSGSVSGRLAGLGMPRRVILSRYDRPVRIVPNSEVARMIARQLEGTDIEIPYNVVTPQVRAELERLGVRISGKASGTVGGGRGFGDAEYITDGEIGRINARGREMAEREPEAMRRHAEALAGRLNTPVRVVTDVEELRSGDAAMQARMRRSKGFFDPATGEVVVVVPNHATAGDVAETVLHEVVAHRGLREMLGEENYDAFCDEIYGHLKDELKEDVDRDATRRFQQEPENGYGHARRVAVDEMLGRLAEKGFEDFTRAERGIWRRLREKVLEAINRFLGSMRLPKWVRLGDNELRYMLWRSHGRLRGKNRRGWG